MLPLEKLLDAISIDSATENTWRMFMTEGHDTVEKIVALDQPQIARIGLRSKKTIGDSRAFKIHTSLHSPRIQELLALSGAWLMTPERVQEIKAESSGKFKIDVAGKTFAMTGTGPIERNVLKKLLQDAGATVGSQVSGNTDYLVCSDPNSNTGKAKAAREKGVTVLDYSELL